MHFDIYMIIHDNISQGIRRRSSFLIAPEITCIGVIQLIYFYCIPLFIMYSYSFRVCERSLIENSMELPMCFNVYFGYTIMCFHDIASTVTKLEAFGDDVVHFSLSKIATSFSHKIALKSRILCKTIISII